MKDSVHIIGCGVIGLTTGVVLAEAGYPVRITAKETPPNTTSDKAGAIWFPAMVAPMHKAAHWGLQSYSIFSKMQKLPDNGVSMVKFHLLGTGEPESNPEWAGGIPPGKFRPVFNNLPAGYSFAYEIETPFIDPTIYLPYLIQRFEATGGSIQIGTFEALPTEKNGKYPLINCTGMGARQLMNDAEMFPLYGHVVQTECLPQATYVVDEGGPNHLAYIFQRENSCILGGTALNTEDYQNALAEGNLKNEIVARCTNLLPEVADFTVLNDYAGIRPGRKEIRLEWDREANVIHNYGHGGAGFTVSWGCAEEVLEMLK